MKDQLNAVTSVQSIIHISARLKSAACFKVTLSIVEFKYDNKYCVIGFARPSTFQQFGYFFMQSLIKTLL